MEALWRARRDDGFRVIGINLSESPEHVKAYVDEMQLTFPVVIDVSGELMETYGVRFTPTHFLIDRSGTVRAGGAGARDWNGPSAHAAVRVLLERRSATSSASLARQGRANSPLAGGTERR